MDQQYTSADRETKPCLACPFASIPKTATGACHRFVASQRELWSFVGFMSDIVLRTDDVTKKAAAALLEMCSPEDRERYEKAAAHGAGAQKRFSSKYGQLIMQTVLCRGTDSFLVYVADLLATIFRARPETMKSGEMMRIDEILEHSTLEELIEAIADKRVTELSYRSVRDLDDFLAKKHSLSLFESPDDLTNAVRIIALRNLIVHNRSVVNRVFNSLVPDSGFQLGDPIKLDFDPVFEDISFLARIVYDVDARAAEKFGLPTQTQPVRPGARGSQDMELSSG